MHIERPFHLLQALVLSAFPILLAAQSYTLTVACPANQSLEECPEYNFSGPVCLNCHPIVFPTAVTDCPDGQVTVEFIGSEVLSGPQDSFPLVHAMDTVSTSGLSAYQTAGFGLIALRFRITDACGNEQFCEYTFENTPVNPVPHYTFCPTDISVSVAGGDNTAIVDFPDPVFQSNCLPYSLYQAVGPPSGSPFPIGTTQVLWVASHVLGAELCQFNITVWPPGYGGDTLCQTNYPFETSEVICASAEGDGYNLVTFKNGVFTNQLLTNSGQLLGATPISVDSSAQGIFDWVDLNPGSFSAGTEIRKLNADGSVAYTVYQPGSLLGFYRSPCVSNRYIFYTSRTSGGGPGGTVIEKFKTEYSFDSDNAVKGYDCAIHIQLSNQQAAYAYTTGSNLTDDGGRLYVYQKNVSSSNDPVNFPLGKTLRVYKNDVDGNLLWEQYLSPDLPEIGCAQIFERPGYQFLLMSALEPQQQFWTYQSDCPANAAFPDLNLGALSFQNANLTNGEVFYYQFDIHNSGQAAAAGEFKVSAWFSTDNVLSPDDFQDGVVNTGNFEAGQTLSQISGASTIPADLPPGNYFLILKVDSDNLIAENNESNNLLVSASAVVKIFALVNETGNASCEKWLGEGPIQCIEPSDSSNILVLSGPDAANQWIVQTWTNEGISAGAPFMFEAPTDTIFIENQKVIKKSAGIVVFEKNLPVSLLQLFNPTVVCEQAGSDRFFVGGFDGVHPVCALLDNDLQLLDTAQGQGQIIRAIQPTSFGGAVLAADIPGTFPQGTLGSFLNVVGPDMQTLYAHHIDGEQVELQALPCQAPDVFRVKSVFIVGGGGSLANFEWTEDYRVSPVEANLLRARRAGFSLSSPTPPVFDTLHIFTRTDGSQWEIIRRVQESSPALGLPGTDTLYYRKRDTTGLITFQVSLDPVVSLGEVFAVTESAPGELIFWSEKEGQSWYYDPFRNCAASGAQNLPGAQSGFSIYPNPASGTVYLNRLGAEDLGSVQVTFFNNLGQKTACRQLEADAFQGAAVEIPLGCLPTGPYWIVLTPAKGQPVVKKLWVVIP
ncbi:MAG TPA: CARDB domain-containing protein [Saprospiraceae bacterium]|nr:CARDB domain-containing protein [Saprospiraceae bacterium]